MVHPVSGIAIRFKQKTLMLTVYPIINRPDHRGDGKCYETYGIDKNVGAVVIVRPDQCEFPPRSESTSIGTGPTAEAPSQIPRRQMSASSSISKIRTYWTATSERCSSQPRMAVSLPQRYVLFSHRKWRLQRRMVGSSVRPCITRRSCHHRMRWLCRW